MNADKYPAMGDGNTKQVSCWIDGVQVSVRHSDDGACLVVDIEGDITLEPRKGSIRLVVKPRTP